MPRVRYVEVSAPGPTRRSSEHDDWQTPQYIVDAIAGDILRVPAFTIDPCRGVFPVTSRNCTSFAGPHVDPHDPIGALDDGLCHCGLCQRWTPPTHYPHYYDDWVFCNPPYSDVTSWVRKAIAEADDGIRSLLLVPNSTDTAWWHEAERYRDQRIDVEGRIPFYLPSSFAAKSGNTGGSTLFIFDRDCHVKGIGTWRRPDRPKDWAPPVPKAPAETGDQTYGRLANRTVTWPNPNNEYPELVGV